AHMDCFKGLGNDPFSEHVAERQAVLLKKLLFAAGRLYGVLPANPSPPPLLLPPLTTCPPSWSSSATTVTCAGSPRSAGSWPSSGEIGHSRSAGRSPDSISALRPGTPAACSRRCNSTGLLN